jgi:hypothetical protein
METKIGPRLESKISLKSHNPLILVIFGSFLCNLVDKKIFFPIRLSRAIPSRLLALQLTSNYTETLNVNCEGHLRPVKLNTLFSHDTH